MALFGKPKNTPSEPTQVVAVVRGKQVSRIVSAQADVDAATSGATRNRAQAALDAARRNANQLEINTANEKIRGDY